VADADGRFTVAGLEAGSYVARVRAPGYRPAERRDLRLSEGQGVELDVALERAPAVMDAVVTTATRSASALTEVPGAVTVVTREQVAEQARLTPRLGPMLAQLVPGLGVGTESMSNYGQSLRGRDVLVLIDGVPQSTSRSVSRDFVTLDPAMVERVEVVRGASAMYGDGATGGVVNIITRRGTGGPLRFTSEVGVESAASAPGDGLGTRLSQTVAGGRGGWDVMAGASYTRTGGLFDADGDRIPPDPTGQGGVAESDGYDLIAKLGWSRGAQRLQLGGNYYRSEQHTDFATDPTVAQDPEGTKARVVEGLQLDEGQGTENAIVNAEYVHGALLGGQLRAQAYYRDYTTTFGPGDRRATASTGHLIFQSFVQSEKLGTRLELTTPLVERLDASLHWGADFTHETTSQPVHTFDPEAYDASGGLVFRSTGDRFWVPPMDQRNLGLFAQLRVSPVERLVVRGGVRHERATMDVDPFTALNGTSITGGRMAFTPTLANLGATLAVTPAVSLFANYSQGFSLADLGRVIRQPPEGFTLASRDAEAQRVDQYEGGVRGAWSRVQGSIAAFRNTSELGTSLGPTLEVVRAPERIHGIEVTLDGQPTGSLGIGGTASWTEGEYRGALGADSAWLALNSFRVQPLKLTAYVEHQATARWRNRVQLLYSGDRDSAYEDYLRQPGADPATPGYGLRPVEHYTTVDLLSRLDVGRGTLSVGVRNLFNARYFPVVSQLRPIGAPSYSAAPGATVSVSYSVTY
jgi:iron complex outermembrane receptor protein